MLAREPSETRGLSERSFWQVIDASLDGSNSVGLTMQRQTQLLEQQLLNDSRFGAHAYNALYARNNFAGFEPNRLRDPENQWSEEDASIQKRCPKVFAAWNNNRRF